MVDNERPIAYFFGRRAPKVWVSGPRARPKMPSRLWRFWALVCIAAGAALSWAVSLSAPTPTIVVRTVLGGAFGLAIGMYVVETIWERRFHDHQRPPTSPIGKRR